VTSPTSPPHLAPTKRRPPGQPLVSVVLPFRDAAATLAEALASLRAQSFEAFECILVDHGSTDGSAAWARSVAAQDGRFRLVHADGSFARALNAGIAAARTALIARMDADDLCHPLRLERQWEALATDPSLTLVSCLVQCFPAAAVRVGMRRYETWLNGVRSPEAIRNALFVESPLAHPTVMFRRAAFDAAGGYREFEGPEDYDLWLRLLLGGARAAKVAEVLLRWRESPQRLSRVDPRYHRRRFLRTKLHYFPTAVAAGSALQICGAGATGRSWARQLIGRGYAIRRFIDVAPPRWGRTVHGAVVHPPDIPDRRHGFILAASGAVGARVRIEDWLRQHGLRPWRDYLAVA
jgi:glycosyltransferase involved in cell wall biosynthesis